MNDRKKPDFLRNYYTLQTFTQKEKVTYGVSHFLANREIKNNDLIQLYNLIIDYVWLGKMPTDGKNHMVEKLLKDIPNLKAVFSCVLPKELNGNAGTHKIPTVLADFWKKRGIRHHLMMIRDFGAQIDVEDIHHTVKIMYSYVSKKEPIYVHCKAGKGRSAMTVLALITYMYLIEHVGLYKQGSHVEISDDFQDAIISFLRDIVKKRRLQVSLNEKQVNKIKEFVAYLLEHQHDPQYDTVFIPKASGDQTSLADIHEYLTSRAGKLALAQLTAIKRLHCYADDKEGTIIQDERIQHIQAFFDNIYEAEGKADWLLYVFPDINPHLDQLNPISKLLAAKTLDNGAPKERLEILNNLQNDISELLEEVFGCSHEHMQQLINQPVAYDYQAAQAIGVNVTVDDIRQFLTSRGGKQVIANLNAMDELIDYAHEHPGSQRAGHIKKFIRDMKGAEDKLQWLYNLYTEKGHIQDLLNAKPGIWLSNGKPKTRRPIIEKLQIEVATLLAEVFGCSIPFMMTYLTNQISEFPKPGKRF